MRPVVEVKLFAQAAEVAGVKALKVDSRSVEEVKATLVDKYGKDFSDVLSISQIWVNGTSSSASDLLDGDEVAVLPPVSGG